MRTKLLTAHGSPPAAGGGGGGGGGPPSPRLIVLLADATIPSVHAVYGDYHDIFSDLFSHSLPRLAQARAEGAERAALELEVRSFDAREGEYPDEEELKAAKGLLITGSAASAYEDIPWITRLVAFTSRLPTAHPALKLIGICFGHQVMALAFGGKVELNPKGWELGVREVGLTREGREVFGAEGSEEGERSRAGTTRIFQVHRDHVPFLPPGFLSLGSTPVCPIQGMIRLSPSSPSPSPSSPVRLSSISILALQGHPEFKPDVVLKVIDAREAKGVIGTELAERSRAFARESDDGIWLGKVILEVVLGAA